jgi:translation elongation factor EF-1beta
MKLLEAEVRAIEKDGLVWGGSKLVAVGFGIKKLQINLVVEDEKISLDELQQQIEEIEEHVQSTDIVRITPYSVLISTDQISRLLCKSCKRVSDIRVHEMERCYVEMKFMASG